MKKTVLILSLLAFLLGGWVAALWLLPSAVYKGNCQEIRYGVNEGLELVEQDNGAKGKRYVVEDADGNELFTIPLRGCLLDTSVTGSSGSASKTLRERDLSTARVW